ncbi:hypothetical protein K503DRAFT_50345 [Rhizopogon vinicolor AM-OR11-026]|uniref:C2H2-type domain-containing protein n=1 Tax=Rhizopogon vinicolor AM-OR11-026 TaxID=1314800 RepID=A0A1B7N4W4_9AGAM|nr:hypothetical protein K503DRAFT_50345 [Rhizopogon vinicolor AM-OR11-026]
MANQSDDRPHPDPPMAFLSHWDSRNGIFLSNGQGGPTARPDSVAFQTSPSSIPSYRSQYSYPGPTGHGPSFVPGVIEHYTNPTDDGSLLYACNDQDSIRFLDEFLASRSSGVSAEEEGAYCSRLDFQAISDEHTYPSLSQQPTPQRVQPILGQPLEQEYGPLLQESVVDSDTPLPQRSPDLLPGTSGNANCPLNALTPHTYCEVQTFYQQLHPRVAQSSKKKVRCTWPGCSKTFRKDGRIRHENEIHWRVVKGVCARCGKVFKRPYLKRKHERACVVNTPT